MPNEAKLSLLIIPTAGSVAVLPTVPQAVRIVALAGIILFFTISLSLSHKPKDVTSRSPFDILEMVSSSYINKASPAESRYTEEKKGDELEKALAMGVPIVPNYFRRE